MDLWSPHTGMSFIMVLLTAYLLGAVHGVTPDEHTWPITFSYSIGSYSVRTGMKIGLAFSLAFTLQRSIMSELAYFALDKIFRLSIVEYIVYLVVGVAMIFGALYIFRANTSFHLHLKRSKGHEKPLIPPPLKTPTLKMAVFHGFIAGFGFGSFALIIYTILVPSMPSPYLGWLPGFLFGLGTMTLQVLLGATFGFITRKLHLSQAAIARVSTLTAARTLLGGGILFLLLGFLGIFIPSLIEWQITTPLYIHNLHNLGAAFVLVIIVVMGIGMGSLCWETHKASALERLSVGKV